MSVSAMNAPQRSQQDQRTAGQRSAAEWVTLAISALIVAGLVAATSYLFLTGTSAPAAMTVEPRLSELYESGGRFYLPVTVRNTGGRTAEDVRVVVSLTDGSGRSENRELLVPFLAGGAEQRAAVSFRSDPRAGELTAAAASFLEP